MPNTARQHDSALVGSPLEQTLIALPAFNEAGTLAQVLGPIRRSCPGAGMLVVDDGSHDETAQVALRHEARVVSHPFRMGYGAALQTGYKYALQHGYAYLAQLDADGQHDPASLPQLLQPVFEGSCDLALGSRFHPASRYRMEPVRYGGTLLFRLIIRATTGLRVTDPTSGYLAMTRRVFGLFAGDCFPVDYPDADMIVLLKRAGLSLREVPITMHRRTCGGSMHARAVSNAYYVFKLLLAISVILLSSPPQAGSPQPRR